MNNKKITHDISESLQKQDLDRVFNAFYRLESLIEEKGIETRNYLSIRLVTIIEQFFRKVIELQIERNDQIKLPDEITIKTRVLETITEKN